MIIRLLLLGPETELLMERRDTLGRRNIVIGRLSLKQLPHSRLALTLRVRLIMRYGILKTSFERQINKVFRRNTGYLPVVL